MSRKTEKKSRSKLLVAPCGKDAAKYACEHWHYSETMPVNLSKPVCYGVWESGEFVGCVIFSLGVSANLHRPYDLKRNEVCELQRVALRAHKTPTTRIVAISRKQLIKRNPNLKLIVSFADQNEGHLGIIYQAGGWRYAGSSKPVKAYYNKRTGKRVHVRNVSFTGRQDKYGVKTHKIQDLRVETIPGKFKYLWPIGFEIESQPYPKQVPLASQA